MLCIILNAVTPGQLIINLSSCTLALESMCATVNIETA